LLDQQSVMRSCNQQGWLMTTLSAVFDIPSADRNRVGSLSRNTEK
jgi:hypothetical protein